MAHSTSIPKPSVYPKKSLSVLMTQSTIYRQHEARLARSNRLKDDPRPAFVRVLSLLPGLHFFVPRYEPSMNNNNKTGDVTKSTSTSTLPLGARYSEETKFIKDDNTPSSSTMEFHTSAQHPMVFPAVLSTAMSAAMAHVLFGKRQPLVLSTNPFQGIPSSTLSLSLSSSSSSSSLRRQTLTTPVPVVMASTAALFGTRVYLEELEVAEANHFFTGAMAGLSSGMVSLLSLSSSLTGNIMTTTGIVSSRYLGSQVLGGMVYFGSYDYLKKFMNWNTTNNHNTLNLWNTALAGAVAGSLQAAILTRLPLVCLRAAPTHALIWCAYESATTHPCPNQTSS